ncbi:MAG: hypothetical protein ABEJ22_09440 [Haloferacaceae archaeon]
MDEKTYEEIVEKDRKERYWTFSDYHDKTLEKKFFYKPFVECPRCGEWKLAAHCHEMLTKESDGLLRGSTETWEVAERWWGCKNCEGKFDVE